MAPTRKITPITLSFRELMVWGTKLPDVKFAILPPSNTRPNPLATEDRIYVSIFAPGVICALERDCGKLIWRHALGTLANASVYFHGTKLFAKTSNTLFALNPASGETLWSFCPYGTDRESIYSSPSGYEDRIYIGDRQGYLHCLNARDGKSIWRRQTNRAHNNDVNSTPLLMNGLVIITTNAKTVVAFDALSGKLAWKQKLDGPAVFGPLAHRNSILAVSDSLYLLSPSGELQQRFSWKKEKIQHAASTPQGIVVTFWPESTWQSKKDPGRNEPSKLRLLKAGPNVQQTTVFEELFCTSIRYAAATRLLYMSHLSGLDLIDPRKGTLLCRLTINNKGSNDGVAPVDVRDKRIYALSGDGRVYALAHPAVTRSA